MEHKHYLKEEKLHAAFRLFDQNNDGFISAKELKDVLGQDDYYKDKTQDFWDNLIKEADTDGNGFIDYEEFLAMM